VRHVVASDSGGGLGGGLGTSAGVNNQGFQRSLLVAVQWLMPYVCGGCGGCVDGL